jgi:hypothetical protein
MFGVRLPKGPARIVEERALPLNPQAQTLMTIPLPTGSTVHRGKDWQRSILDTCRQVQFDVVYHHWNSLWNRKWVVSSIGQGSS